ncbi:hypothetical protein PQO03_21805 [Lentisphaera profundi]|uniref:CN hydrolase domain-containing protein n=1 Tax=Lentisphaera profundi TaxID=1658616 RepID=A0ABY7VXD4_9BACT|nr:nitrilase-related carbon-nitrogen hydrolase [Lentisphaera profundi]WDE98449.1 hypothetical protein PQO03_21805 [Lentisphaera profundi]
MDEKNKSYMNGKEFLIPLAWLISACLSFHLSHLGLTAFFPLFFLSLWQITKIKSIPIAFINGIILGFGIYTYHLQFFISIFNHFAYNLFCVLAFWLALFLAISVWLRRVYSSKTIAWLIPVLYFSLEFIRCELYPLKFSWVIPGLSFSESSYYSGLGIWGVYGISFFCFLLITFGENWIEKKKLKIIAFVSLCLLCQISSLMSTSAETEGEGPHITGIQWEMGSHKDILDSLDQALETYPDTKLFFLSEYSFDEGIPQLIKDWCQVNQRYLLAGTTETIKESAVINKDVKSIGGKKKKRAYFNMAMIVDPRGEIIFKQAKVMPIQFFNDGEPAKSQQLWDSPWGKIGIGICYDLSYSKIMDELVRQGAQALLIPTMDVEHWGEQQHKLHGRIAPTRAGEYGIPVYRVCSSGISQFVDAQGHIQAQGSFIGQGDTFSAKLVMAEQGTRPLDRFLIYPALIISFLAFLFSFFKAFKKIR